MKYTVDYFINKFKNIPNSKWTTGAINDSDTGKHCALGHCHQKHGEWTNEQRALIDLFVFNLGQTVQNINDFGQVIGFKGSNPKSRILNALKKIKRGSK